MTNLIWKQYTKYTYYFMSETYSREKTVIKTSLPVNHVWSLFQSLDFWLEVLPKKTSQLSLETDPKAGVRGQVVFNGQTYLFNIISWEENRLISFKVSDAKKGLFLLQISFDTNHKKPQTSVTLEIFDYTKRWWQKFLPGMNVSRWYHQLVKNLKLSLNSLIEARADQVGQASNEDQAQVLDLPQGFYLWHKSNRYSRKLKRVLKPFHLTPTQWFILKAINDLGQKDKNLTHEDVATALKLHPVVVSDMVATLVRKNLVRKLKPPQNKRAFYLYPSPVGKQLLQASTPSVKQFDEEFFSQT